MKNYFDFLLALIEKEISARYKRAVFGISWMVINPILQMLIIGFVFSLFIKIPNYYLFLLTGLLPWTFFSRSVSRATSSIVDERALLQKAKFSIEAIPLSVIFSDFINLAITLIFLIIFLALTKIVIVANILLLVPTIIWLLSITIGISLLTSALHVKNREIAFIVRNLLILGFYGTPILYSLALIPENLRILFTLNPLASIFELFHLSLLNQGTIYPNILISNIFLSMIIIILGILIFVKKRKQFVDWI